MTRDRRRDAPLGPFSEWHRETLPSWYTYIDIDYAGYIDPKEWPQLGHELYVLVELIHIPNDSVWGPDIAEKYPLHNHKRQVYQNLEQATNVPVFVVWHNHKCTEFVIRRLGAGDFVTHHFDNWGELADVFDHLRQSRINELQGSGSEGATADD